MTNAPNSRSYTYREAVETSQALRSIFEFVQGAESGMNEKGRAEALLALRAIRKRSHEAAEYYRGRIHSLVDEVERIKQSRFELAADAYGAIMDIRQYLDAARSEEQHAGTWSEWDERMWQRTVEITGRLDTAVTELTKWQSGMKP